MSNRLFGPRERLEIILCQYEDNRIFYQFNGMDGKPCEPVEVHRLLVTVANALAGPAPEVTVPQPITAPVPHLLPEESHDG